MNTPAHAIISSAILRGHNQSSRDAWLILIGALLPDIPMVVFFVWERFIMGTSNQVIWGDMYFHSWWTIVFDLFNSIPLFAIAILIGYIVKSRWTILLFASMMIHAIFDLPVHTIDAHRHFYPFSDYKFISPYSYWNPNEGGDIIGFVEITLMLICSWLIWPKLRSMWTKSIIVILNIIAIAGYIGLHLPWWNM